MRVSGTGTGKKLNAKNIPATKITAREQGMWMATAKAATKRGPPITMDNEHHHEDLILTTNANKQDIRNLSTHKTAQKTTAYKEPKGSLSDAPAETLAIFIPIALNKNNS